MENQAWFEGEITDDASIDGRSSAALYGKGIFTTLAVRGGDLFLWDKHWKRLTEAAHQLSIDISFHPEELVLIAVRGTIEAKGLVSGRARLTFFDEGSSSLWHGRPGATKLLIAAAENRPRPDHLKLTLSSRLVNSSSPLAGLKSCNYLENLMSYKEARDEGFDEAIRINEIGSVTSVCMANVFWEKSGKLFTPSLSTGCLAGTTREYVMENLECEEVEAGIEAIESADRIFLTSAGLAVAPVAEFNGRQLDVSDHPMLRLIPE